MRLLTIWRAAKVELSAERNATCSYPCGYVEAAKERSFADSQQVFIFSSHGNSLGDTLEPLSRILKR